MIQLAIETSGRVGSIAVMSDRLLLESFPLPTGKRTAAMLTTRLRDAIQWCESNGHRTDFVSVADGPGSFTGLRIGVTTAKTYCYATGIPLVAIDSVAALATIVMAQDAAVESVLVAVNAYRGQIFAGTYKRQSLLPARTSNDSETSAVKLWNAHMRSAQVLDPNQWQHMVSTASQRTAFAGDEAAFPKISLPRFQHRKRIDAYGVGALGYYAASWQQWVDPMQLLPRYLKSSAAEEQASRRNEGHQELG